MKNQWKGRWVGQWRWVGLGRVSKRVGEWVDNRFNRVIVCNPQEHWILLGSGAGSLDALTLRISAPGNKLVPCVWLSSGALEVWQQRVTIICFLGLAPPYMYLRDLCCPTPGTRGRNSLRSSEQRLLFVPFARTSTTQARAFSVVGPSVWSGIPLSQRLLPRILSDTFYSSLKTLLFSRARVGSASE